MLNPSTSLKSPDKEPGWNISLLKGGLDESDAWDGQLPEEDALQSGQPSPYYNSGWPLPKKSRKTG